MSDQWGSLPIAWKSAIADALAERSRILRDERRIHRIRTVVLFCCMLIGSLSLAILLRC